MSSYSKSKVSAFFGSHHDNQLRESIRQDVLIERYDDLQKEMAHIEDLLNISEEDFDDDLYAITESLFDIIETLVPSLLEEEKELDESEPIEEIESPEQRRAKRSQEIKKREMSARGMEKNKEKYVRAKSNIKSAQISAKGAQSPEAKKAARGKLRAARQSVAKAGIKHGTTQT
jgi:hypothetical protein